MFLLQKYNIFALETIDKLKKLQLSVIPLVKDDLYSVCGGFSVHVYVFKVLTIILLFYRILHI